MSFIGWIKKHLAGKPPSELERRRDALVVLIQGTEETLDDAASKGDDISEIWHRLQTYYAWLEEVEKELKK